MQGMAEALRGSGASLMIVRPGWVATRMTEGRDRAPFATTPDAVAADVVAGITGRSPRTNVVITGRDAAPELVEIADTVTEMRKVKHAYERGIKARKGIEY